MHILTLEILGVGCSIVDNESHDGYNERRCG